MSLSKRMRDEGNAHYQSALPEGLAPVLKRQRFEKALQCYDRAKELATDSEELASALKNTGNANWRIAKILVLNSQEHRVTVAHYFQEAVKSLDLAFYKGHSCKPAEWIDGILSSLSSCLEEAVTISQTYSSTDDRLQMLEQLSHCLTCKQRSLDLQLEIGKLTFHDGVTKLQKMDYKGTLSRLKNCYYHIEEAKKLASAEQNMSCIGEIQTLEQDVLYHVCAAESIQARETGRQLLDWATKQEEELNMDLIWDVIDWYKQATILARELDIEQEAIALSYLGFVYDSVLKLQSKAKAYYMRCLQLAESLKPRTFFTCSWYQDCVATVKRYQEEAQRKEEQEKERKNAKVLEELKEELADIKLHNTGKLDLLKHLYTKYPPTFKKWKKPSAEDMDGWSKLERKDVKKLLLNATIAYHPDKVDEKEHGEKWKVLTEEITKLITPYYEEMK